jgi:hypothetical protein
VRIGDHDRRGDRLGAFSRVADLFYAADPDRLRDDVVRHDQDGDRHGP